MTESSTTNLVSEAYTLWRNAMDNIKRAIDEKPNDFMLVLCDLILENERSNGKALEVESYIDLATVIRHKLRDEVACQSDAEYWNLADWLKDHSMRPSIQSFDVSAEHWSSWAPTGENFKRPPGIEEISSKFFSDSAVNALTHPIASICKMLHEGVPVYLRKIDDSFVRMSLDHPDVALMSGLGRDSLSIDSWHIPDWIRNYWFKASDVAAHEIFFKRVEWGEKPNVVDTLRASYHKYIFPNGFPAASIQEEKVVLERMVKSLKRHVTQLENENAKLASTTAGHTSNKISKWPWGDHHTEMLGHLDAAATRYWVNYDPADLTTASTNVAVSEWLQSERNVSRTMADSIASMLRADGLPTGPRK